MSKRIEVRALRRRRRRLPLPDAAGARGIGAAVLFSLVGIGAGPRVAVALQAQGLTVSRQRVDSLLAQAAVLASSAPGSRETAAPMAGTLAMSLQLADNLALLFEKFGESEFVVCVEGEVDDQGRLGLRDFRMPHIAYSRAASAGVDPGGDCDQYADIVGTLHTHPPTYPEDRSREWANCYLSRPDIVGWLEHTDYPYTMVMCGPRMWAWWHRSQVSPEKVLAFPRPGQFHGRPTESISPN